LKKILASIVLAVLLGVGVMLLPYHLLNDKIVEEGPYLRPAISGGIAERYGLSSALYPDVLFIAFMLALSFIIAFGVMRYSLEKIAL
jgi:hypothetical protein